MKMAKFRYINQTGDNVLLPSRGPRIAEFRPGQYSEDDFYAQYVGEGGLTRIPAEGQTAATRLERAKTIARERKQAELRQRILDGSNVLPPRPEDIVPEPVKEILEPHGNWTQKLGIYYCSHCEMFRTGSRLAMVSHLESYHGLDLTVEPEEEELETEEVKVGPPQRTPVVDGVLQDD